MFTFISKTTANFSLLDLKRVENYLESWNVAYSIKVFNQYEGDKRCSLTFDKELDSKTLQKMSEYSISKQL